MLEETKQPTGETVVRYICYDCKKIITYTIPSGGGASGYALLGGRDKPEEKDQQICYECCAIRDVADMKRFGKATMYLTSSKQRGFTFEVTNWPGTLKFPCPYSRQGKHNIARNRTDVWFKGPDDFIWHGVHYGDWSQIVHVQRTKHKKYEYKHRR